MVAMTSNIQIDEQSTTPISFPHSPQWSREENLLLTTTDGTTVAVEYAIDIESGGLTEVWSHGREEALYSAALGEVQEVHSGGHVVSFWNGGIGPRIKCRRGSDMVFTRACRQRSNDLHSPVELS